MKTSIKIHAVLMSLLVFPLYLSAEELPVQSKWLWPIAGKQAGDNILFRPQQYIGDEDNFDDLFIGADYGSVVIAPCDGVLAHFNVEYSQSLIYMNSYHNAPGLNTLDSMLESLRQGKDVPREITGCISINAGKGIMIHIAGIEGSIPLKTGMKIQKGDTLGTVGYGYQKVIKEPHIRVSVSRYSKPDDPMSPFGLKTTFIPQAELKIPERLTEAEALEDYEALLDAFKEAFPSLNDVASPDKLAELDSKVRTAIAGGISYEDFYYMLLEVNKVIHDSHITCMTAIPGNDKEFGVTKLLPGSLGDSLLVFQAVQTHEKYLKKRILSIDGVPADSLIRFVKGHVLRYDMNVESLKAVFAANAWNYYVAERITDLKKGRKIEYCFADGEVFHDEFMSMRQFSKITKVPVETVETNRIYRTRFKYKEKPYVFDMPNDSTCYFGLGSFVLNEAEMEEIADSLAAHIDVPYMIVDVRNNGGGETETVDRMLGWFLNAPAVNTGSYSFVNKKSGFESFRNCLNYLTDTEIFPDFSAVDGKEGYYLYPDADSRIIPDSLLNYKGRLYVLADETSVSAATMFPAVLMRNHRAVIVGRETRTGYHFMTALKFADIRLPNSYITFRIPLVKCVYDDTFTERTPAGRGVLPDYEVPLSYEELLINKNDVMIDKALDLIAEGKYLGENPFAEIDAASGKGMSPYAKILVNIIIPIIAAGLLVSVVMRLLRRRRQDDGAKKNI